MDWSAFAGGLAGAGIPAALAYLGLHRARQPAGAEAFGPAVVLLDRINPEWVAMSVNPDASVERAKWAQLQRQLEVARERLLIVSAGNPRRHVRELARGAEAKVTNAFQASGWVAGEMQASRDISTGMGHARTAHAEAEDAMRTLIDANFGWSQRRGRLRWPRHETASPPSPDTRQTRDRQATSRTRRG